MKQWVQENIRDVGIVVIEMITLILAAVSTAFDLKDVFQIEQKWITLAFLLIFAAMVFYHFYSLNQKIRSLKNQLSLQTADENSMLLYPYSAVRDCVEMKCMGPEAIKDIEVALVYIGKDRLPKHQTVDQFFRQDDLTLSGQHFVAHVLTENEVARFRLVKGFDTADYKVTSEAKFVGVRSGKKIEVRKDFDLNELVL